MMESFQRTVGPRADVKELEYIAALHQTCANLTRVTGTVSTLDVMRFLKSRHSLDLTQSQARDIVRVLGGGIPSPEMRKKIATSLSKKAMLKASLAQQVDWKDTGRHVLDDPEELAAMIAEVEQPKLLYLDLVQLTSILIIPMLAKDGNEWLERNSAQKERQNSRHVDELGRLHGGQAEMRSSRVTKVGSTSPDDTTSGAAKTPASTVDNQANDSVPPGGNRPTQPNDLLQLVWLSILDVVRNSDSGSGQVTGRTTLYPEVTPALVQELLDFHGEFERANDPALIQRMVEAATSPSGCFDERALVSALTSDLTKWDVTSTNRSTTYVDDVFGHTDLQAFQRQNTNMGVGSEEFSASTGNEVHPGGSNNHDSKQLSETENGEEKEFEDGKKKNRPDPEDTRTEDQVCMEDEISQNRFSSSTSCSKEKETVQLDANGSLAPIDSVVDSYASNSILMLAWLAYILNSSVYAGLLLASDAVTVECEVQTFGCKLGETILSWFILALMLSGFGLLVLLPLSYGNHPTKREPGRMLFATGLAALVAIVPFLAVYYAPRSDLTSRITTSFNISTGDLVYTTTALGGLITLLYFAYFLVGFGSSRKWTALSGNVRQYLMTTSHILGEVRVKKSAAWKIRLLLENALDMHGDFDDSNASTAQQRTSTDEILQNFLIHGEQSENVASLGWTWRELYTGDLSKKEGIWLPSRLWIFQFAQMVGGCATCIFLFALVDKAAKAAKDASADLPPRGEDDNIPDWVYAMVPSESEVRLALTPAALISVGVVVLLTLVYIPSTVKTTMQYRCGQLPSLGSASFNLARSGADMAYMNTANAVYGLLAAGLVFFFLIGLVSFLFVWEFTADVMRLVLAWGIGLGITIGLKMMLTTVCRKRFFRAFYRVYPAQANLSSLALECWFMGLGGGVLVGRITQFLLAAAFWVGRIDEPFLADNVSLLGYKFDYVPQNYINEILVHEAHRHPYIETLGAMYLMRLRYKSFGSEAGGCWRQLFVLTLMPWLVKHRVFHEQRCTESLKDQESELEIQTFEEKDAVAAMVADATGAGAKAAGVVDDGTKVMTTVGLGALEVGLGAVEKGVEAVTRTGQAVAHTARTEDP